MKATSAREQPSPIHFGEYILEEEWIYMQSIPPKPFQFIQDPAILANNSNVFQTHHDVWWLEMKHTEIPDCIFQVQELTSGQKLSSGIMDIIS